MPSRQYGLLQVLQEFIATLPPSIERYKRVSTVLETLSVNSDALQAVLLMTFKAPQKKNAKGRAGVLKQAKGNAEGSKDDLRILNAGHELPESSEEARLLANALTNRLQNATLVRIRHWLPDILLTPTEHRFYSILSDRSTYKKSLENGCWKAWQPPASQKNPNLSPSRSSTHSKLGSAPRRPSLTFATSRRRANGRSSSLDDPCKPYQTRMGSSGIRSGKESSEWACLDSTAWVKILIKRQRTLQWTVQLSKPWSIPPERIQCPAIRSSTGEG